MNGFMARRELFPTAAHNVERISRDAVHPVVCAVHNELNALCDRAKLSDDQLVSQKLIVVSDMVFKFLRAIHVIVVGIVADNNVRSGYDVLDKYDLLDSFVRIYAIRIRPHKLTLSSPGSPFQPISPAPA